MLTSELKLADKTLLKLSSQTSGLPHGSHLTVDKVTRGGGIFRPALSFNKGNAAPTITYPINRNYGSTNYLFFCTLQVPPHSHNMLLVCYYGTALWVSVICKVLSRSLYQPSSGGSNGFPFSINPFTRLEAAGKVCASKTLNSS